MALCSAAVILAACSSSASPPPAGRSSSPTRSVPGGKGGTITWAEAPMQAPSYIFPINACCFSVPNTADFQYLMYRPLYWFGTGNAPTLNTSESLAEPPTYSGNKVTINIKPGLQWSDGEPVDAADVVFFMNMLRTVGHVDWGAYEPGYFPDNVSNVVATSKLQVTLTLTRKYNDAWFTYNELSQITPFPIAWDVTNLHSANGSGRCSSAAFASIKVGSTRATPVIPQSPGAAACFAVYNFLANANTGQAASPDNYADNPLWATVDGPWKLASMDATTGDIDFVPNAAYKGPQKPYVDHFDEVGYQTESTEYQALEGGRGPDVGYVSPQDIPPTQGDPLVAGGNSPRMVQEGYNLAPSYIFGINYLPLNFANPSVGPIFRQSYARQALQMGIDQEGFIERYDAGYGVASVGPVPVVPRTYVSAAEDTNPFAFDPIKGRQLLEANGWSVPTKGAARCTRPGRATGDCGAGISEGERFAFTFLWETGSAVFQEQVSALKSDWALEGIDVTLEAEQLSTLVTTAGLSCYLLANCSRWQAADWGSGWEFAPDYLPTGEDLFYGAAPCNNANVISESNAGSYCDPEADRLILATTESNSPDALSEYENYLTRQLPVLWQPITPTLVEIKNYLEGVTPFSVFGNLNPEYWYWEVGHVSGS
jgi:peptide/nickel transport system substrate-binding protein